MKLYFIRHGETDWNKARKIQGRADIFLNEFGRSLARKTAKGLADIPFTVCYSSPLERARETAEIILNGKDVPIIEDSRIVEMAFGIYSGKCCSKKNWEVPDDFQRFFDDPEHYEAPEGGENFRDVLRRTNEFLMELYKEQETEEKCVLITTHGTALAGLLTNIKRNPISQYWGKGVHKNCAVTEVKVHNGVAEILSENIVYYDDYVEPWED